MNLSEGKRIGYFEVGQALRGGVWVSLGGQMTDEKLRIVPGMSRR